MFSLSTATNKDPKFLDYWLINGNKNWSCVKDKLAEKIGVPNGTPIRLHVGKRQTFGAEHIYHPKRHTQINAILKKNPNTNKRLNDINLLGSHAAEFVWLKLQQSGTCYSTEVNNKTQLVLQAAPSCWMFMSINQYDLNDIYLSIITLYQKQSSQIDGDNLGRYQGKWVGLI